MHACACKLACHAALALGPCHFSKQTLQALAIDDLSSVPETATSVVNVLPPARSMLVQFGALGSNAAGLDLESSGGWEEPITQPSAADGWALLAAVRLVDAAARPLLVQQAVAQAGMEPGIVLQARVEALF